MAQHRQRLEQAEATVVVISFEARDPVAALRDRLALPFTVALDADRAAYRQFGLGRAGVLRTYAHPNVVLFYGKALLRGRAPDLHRGQDRRQLAGDFVLDREGVVVLAHPEKGPEDRVSVGAMVRAVEDAAS